MSKISELLQKYVKVSFLDEDGNALHLKLLKGASLSEILKFEAKNKINLPYELRDLLLFSNGLDLFGQHLLPLEKLEYFSSGNVLMFHKWGNGDFDCITIGKENAKGKIVFMLHSEEILIPLNISLYEWIRAVISEIKEKGTLLHPYDFTMRKEEGLYKQVLEYKSKS
jgi:hypothetical protein